MKERVLTPQELSERNQLISSHYKEFNQDDIEGLTDHAVKVGILKLYMLKRVSYNEWLKGLEEPTIHTLKSLLDQCKSLDPTSNKTMNVDKFSRSHSNDLLILPKDVGKGLTIPILGMDEIDYIKNVHVNLSKQTK